MATSAHPAPCGGHRPALMSDALPCPSGWRATLWTRAPPCHCCDAGAVCLLTPCLISVKSQGTRVKAIYSTTSVAVGSGEGGGGRDPYCTCQCVWIWVHASVTRQHVWQWQDARPKLESWLGGALQTRGRKKC